LAAVLMIGAAAADSASATTTTTIRVWSTETASRLVHNAPPKAVGTKGDVIAISDRLKNASRQFGKPAHARMLLEA